MLLLKVSEEPKATIVKALTSTMPKANRPITPLLFMPLNSTLNSYDLNPYSTAAKTAYLNSVEILNLAGIGYIFGVQNHTE
jgi:hypothetical protein